MKTSEQRQLNNYRFKGLSDDSLRQFRDTLFWKQCKYQSVRQYDEADNCQRLKNEVNKELLSRERGRRQLAKWERKYGR